MNKKNKNKKINGFNKYYILILVLIVVIGIISATYAFFQIDTNSSDYEPTTITANTDCFSIEFEDLSQDGLNNLDVNYPITDEYALGKTDSIYNLKPIVVKISNKCTNIQDNLNYKLAITTLAKNPVNEQDKGYIPDNKVRYNVKRALNKDTEENSESLRNPDYLSSLSLVEDANIISILNEEITNKGINLKNYNTVNTYIIDSGSLASNTYSTYYLRLWIDYYEGDSEAYTNPEGHEDRTYTCGDNQCKYDNSTEGQQFESVISLIADGTTSERPKSTIDILREKEAEVSGGVKYLSTDEVPEKSGMYRYQGTDNVPNWILFGTREKCEKDEEEKCTNITDSDGNKMTYEDYVDKYMYRIIGITKEGQLYLLKETFLKEGSVMGFAWDDVYQISGSGGDACPDGKCPEWNTSDLFQRINGTANGSTPGEGDNDDKKDDDTDIFVDSAYYDYLKSEDNIVDGNPQPSEWYNLIETHNWMYGDTTESSYDGNTIYAIETGQTPTTHYVQNPEGSTTVESKEDSWTGSVPAKISLMYMHDVLYAYPGASGAGSSTSVKSSWIHFQKDRYNSSPNYEWLSTRWGILSARSPSVDARRVDDNGNFGSNHLYIGNGVRPVFYLSSNARITDGNGTKDSPFILG